MESEREVAATCAFGEILVIPPTYISLPIVLSRLSKCVNTGQQRHNVLAMR
jgi:hypothetical protein